MGSHFGWRFAASRHISTRPLRDTSKPAGQMSEQERPVTGAPTISQFGPRQFRSRAGREWTIANYQAAQTIFTQGETADCILFCRVVVFVGACECTLKFARARAIRRPRPERVPTRLRRNIR